MRVLRRYASVERKDVMLLLGQALHAADISNPTKSRGLMMKWTERVMKEFWAQGAKQSHAPQCPQLPVQSVPSAHH